MNIDQKLIFVKFYDEYKYVINIMKYNLIFKLVVLSVLMLWTFNPFPHAVMTPYHNISFAATVINYNVNTCVFQCFW